ncbi:MAG: dihydroneopterin aldolase [Acidimicrobiales bacterium]
MAPPADDDLRLGRSGQGWGRIEIRDLRVMGVHGVLPEERERAQPFAIDVDIRLDTRRSAESDTLEDTVDYGALCERSVDVVATTSYRLLEALADAVARALLEEDERVVAAAVTVRKMRPPIAAQLGSVGVRVVRGREVAPAPPDRAHDRPSDRAPDRPPDRPSCSPPDRPVHDPLSGAPEP